MSIKGFHNLKLSFIRQSNHQADQRWRQKVQNGASRVLPWWSYHSPVQDASRQHHGSDLPCPQRKRWTRLPHWGSVRRAPPWLRSVVMMMMRERIWKPCMTSGTHKSGATPGGRGRRPSDRIGPSLRPRKGPRRQPTGPKTKKGFNSPHVICLTCCPTCGMFCCEWQGKWSNHVTRPTQEKTIQVNRLLVESSIGTIQLSCAGREDCSEDSKIWDPSRLIRWLGPNRRIACTAGRHCWSHI